MPLPFVENSPSPFVKLNGHEISRTSIDLLWDAIPIVGYTGLTHKSARAPGISHASRSKPTARTRGKVTFTADLTVYETTWSQLRNYLVIKGQDFRLGWSEVESVLTVTYFEPSLGPGSQVIVIVGAQVIEAEAAISDSDDQLTRKLTLSVMDILENGVSCVLERTATGL